MVEQEFIRLLKEYPDSLETRKRFIGLVNDFLYMQPLQANLVLTLYKMGIHKEIEKTSRLDNTFAYRFVKRLTDEHGISRENAARSVFIWCLCYGEKILEKLCEMDTEHDAFHYEDALIFLEKLRDDKIFDSECLDRVFSTIPQSSYNDFLNSVYTENKLVYYGIIAAKMNSKFKE
ncbi:MAG: hypothetical protein FWG33_02615 [Oscillospiraceae bacterium]|nr:hypothetical protein [Oscillospiraceae bacterium]